MKYFLRLNHNRELVREVEHLEDVSDTEVRIRDKVTFPFMEEPIRVYVIELLDENDEIWALRRIPPICELVISPYVQVTFNWALTIMREIREEEPNESETEGDAGSAPME